MEHNFQPLLFGGDINVYSVARAFHEAYGVKSVCFGKFASGPAYGSDIIDYRVCAKNDTFMCSLNTLPDPSLDNQ